MATLVFKESSWWDSVMAHGKSSGVRTGSGTAMQQTPIENLDFMSSLLLTTAVTSLKVSMESYFRDFLSVSVSM